jgi:DNA invertase Pin-like site-specific DNA recombinase
MTSAAIYARVSPARQKKDQTIGSQTQALREHAAQNRLEVPPEWVFEDEGHSGATLVRPALEALRDLAAQGCLDVVLVYSPDRLARKFACQALLIEEFARAGVGVEFVTNGARGDSPEDQLLVQFQGMFAEYEKAQLMERYRRGKAHRARAGSVNVLGGAPFGYRYVRKNDHAGAAYEIAEDEAALVAEMFRRYADDGASIADVARWLTSQGVLTRTGKHRWDRSVIWGMLRNPACAGRAVFGKTMAIHESPGLNRVARLQGRSVPRAVKTVDRPREEWTEIPVPAIVSNATFERVQQRLADNKRFAARNTKVPSLLQGLAACSACGYGYYRTSTRTTNKKICYYRCLGSDDYRYEGGRVCHNQPARADYLDTVVWDHITGLLADPALIRAEISKRLEAARTSGLVTSQRKTPRRRPRKGHRVDHRHDRGAVGAANHHRRAALPDAAPARPGSKPPPAARRPPGPGRRPGRLPQARRQPGRLPHPAAHQHRHRHRRRPPASAAAACQRHPRRPREDHHPPPHPRSRRQAHRPQA